MLKLPQALQSIGHLASKISNDELKQSIFINHILGVNPSRNWNSDALLHGNRYLLTPPELFIIADYGIDGACAGLLIHAPEVPQVDYPVGCYCMCDNSGVVFGGHNTRHFIEMRLSAMLRCWNTMGQDEVEIKRFIGKDTSISPSKFSSQLRAKAKKERKQYIGYINEITENLEISPSPDMGIFGWGAKETEMTTPSIPVGYYYMRTPDHVGVLARKEHFDFGFNKTVTWKSCRDDARQLMRHNFPASALHVLKTHARDVWMENALEYVELKKDLQDVYEKLSRPFLAQAVMSESKI